VFLAAGTGDLLADPTDVDNLELVLKNSNKNYLRKNYDWGHMGFFVAKDIVTLMVDSMQ